RKCEERNPRRLSGRERGLSAHSWCSEHERRWNAEDHVRAYLHQGYRSPLRQHHLLKGRRGHEQKVVIL
ncbi:unnamed protein product, partial [Musa acuminata var. zebrina]